MTRIAHDPRTARWPHRVSLVLAALLVAAGVGSTQGRTALEPVSGGSEKPVPAALLFDPVFAPAAKGGTAQLGEEWDGTAPVPDPLGVADAADLREFQVLSGFDNDLLTVTITWDPGPALSYDLDLYVERRTDSGAWVEVGSSTDGQLLGDGEAREVADVQAPSPGTYRTRVVNWASTQLEYHGSIAFTSFGKEKRGGKPSGGRATQDRPDLVQDPQLHVIYFVPSDGLDEELDTNGVLDDAVASLNLWLDGQTGGRHLRLDTYLDRKTPRLDVSFVRGNRTAGEYAQDPDGAFVAVTDELEERGWTASPALKRYLVYYAGPAESANICGTAYYNILDTGFAQWSVVFLGASPGCGARDFGAPATGAGMSEAIALQELVHNEGVVRPQALHHCSAFAGHICTAAAGAALGTLDPESVDVMFPFVTFPLREKVLDPGRDDYFEHPFLHRDLADSPYLESQGG